MITQQRLKQFIQYNPDTGVVRWKNNAPLSIRHRWHRDRACGFVRPDGYLSVSIEGKKYMAHRLIWLLMTGQWPTQIDHKDLNRLNNCWNNLREANKSQNGVNRDAPKSNSLGYKGIGYQDSKIKKWCAFIRVGGKKVNIGAFDTKEDAALAYNKAAKKYYGEFARLNKLVLFLFIFGWMIAPALAIECQSAPGSSESYWSYRIIDNSRCWYKGHGRKPKSELHWPDEPKPKKIKGNDPVFNQIRAEASGLDAVTWHMARPFDQTQPITPPLSIAVPDEPDACCWPPLSEFDRRFTGEPQ